MKKILSLLAILITLDSNAQSPEKFGYRSYTLNTTEWGDIHYYVSLRDIEKTKGVIIYLNGSGPYPLFQYTKQGTMSTIPFEMDSMGKKYHVVIISKPGVPFIDSVSSDITTGMPIYAAPPEYTKRLSLEWRANTASLVLEDVLKNLKTDNRHIAVIGISEGFQVGAKLLAINKHVTQAMLYVGNGLRQFYDFILHYRTDAATGAIGYKEAQENIDSLGMVIKDILAHPNATDKQWYGHSYKRWSSFGNYTPADDILKSNIPIYIVAAARDHNSAVGSADYIYLESIMRHKKNITYVAYPYDHFFNEYDKDNKPVNNHSTDVMDAGINWLEKQ